MGSECSTHSHLLHREGSAGSSRLLLVLWFRARTYESISWLRWRRLYHFRQAFGRNLHERPERNAIIKLGNIARLHPNAAVTGRPTDLLLLRRSMNVNATLEGVRVLRLQPAQPNNASGDRVTAGRIGLQNFASKSPIVKDGAGGRVIANFFSTAR